MEGSRTRRQVDFPFSDHDKMRVKKYRYKSQAYMLQAQLIHKQLLFSLLETTAEAPESISTRKT